MVWLASTYCSGQMAFDASCCVQPSCLPPLTQLVFTLSFTPDGQLDPTYCDQHPWDRKLQVGGVGGLSGVPRPARLPAALGGRGHSGA